jgi:hypothetical protein
MTTLKVGSANYEEMKPRTMRIAHEGSGAYQSARHCVVHRAAVVRQGAVGCQSGPPAECRAQARESRLDGRGDCWSERRSWSWTARGSGCLSRFG